MHNFNSKGLALQGQMKQNKSSKKKTYVGIYFPSHLTKKKFILLF